MGLIGLVQGGGNRRGQRGAGRRGWDHAGRGDAPRAVPCGDGGCCSTLAMQYLACSTQGRPPVQDLCWVLQYPCCAVLKGACVRSFATPPLRRLSALTCCRAATLQSCRSPGHPRQHAAGHHRPCQPGRAVARPCTAQLLTCCARCCRCAPWLPFAAKRRRSSTTTPTTSSWWW